MRQDVGSSRRDLDCCRWSICLAIVAICTGASAKEPAKPTPQQAKFFEEKVRPLLVANCSECHSEDEQEGDLRLDSLAHMKLGGESGPAIEPGEPEKSLLIEAVNYESVEMPPDGQLKAAEIAILSDWIKMGAPWPGSDASGSPLRKREKISDEDRAWWAFQPVKDPAVPQVENDNWPRNDIDRFVLRKLQAEQLQPAGEADKRQLIRRLSFDLVGLPPSPEEMQAFVNDDSPDAYEKLVDRLLGSPGYGEKWARHWLDLVRYAESDGYRADHYRPEAWRYRDYVIASFNDDKPYNQFIIEQLAGDEVAPGDRDALTATMYLRHGMYEHNQRDVMGQRQHILDEIVDTTADTFLGMGMSCARCHDHKFDPLLQKDYFRLQAFFAPLMWKETVPLADVPARRKYEEQLAHWKELTADIRREIDEIERPILIKHAGGEGFEKFTPQLKAMITKRPVDRDPLEHQLAELAMRQMPFNREKLDEHLKGDKKQRWKELQAKLAEYEKEKPQPLPQVKFAVGDVGTTPPAVFITGKERLGEVAPGFLSVLDDSDAKISAVDGSLQSTGRRAALARWIASDDNPLSTRVIVNRLWQYHFGVGLTANASDFGRLGDPPSHPQLRDWLTSRFVEGDWRLKPLHKLIVMSATYRQSATAENEAALLVDPSNRLLWRQNIRRLDAEQVRDSVLAVAGELDTRRGGASVGAGSTRRTIYTKVMRNTRDELLAVFDAPDGTASSADRSTTTNAMQALLLLNSDWPQARSKKLAARLQREAPGSLEDQVQLAYQLCFGREAASDEVAAALQFIGTQQAIIDSNADRGFVTTDDNERGTLATAKFPTTGSPAAVLKPSSQQKKLVVPFDESLPSGNFTVEALVQLHSLYEDATVRTIAAHWNSKTTHPGWAFGVTSKKSKYKPGNLILQLVGRTASGQMKYEVVPSDIHLELNQPYYVAVSVNVGDTSEDGVTFYVKKLIGDGQLQTTSAAHEVVRDFRPEYALNLGGRENTNRHYWDGLIDDVRISTAVLAGEQLLIGSKEPGGEATVGQWRFDGEGETPLADQSSQDNNATIASASEETRPAPPGSALVDFCHVLLNANEFLYVD